MTKTAVRFLSEGDDWGLGGAEFTDGGVNSFGSDVSTEVFSAMGEKLVRDELINSCHVNAISTSASSAIQ